MRQINMGKFGIMGQIDMGSMGKSKKKNNNNT